MNKKEFCVYNYSNNDDNNNDTNSTTTTTTTTNNNNNNNNNNIPVDLYLYAMSAQCPKLET